MDAVPPTGGSLLSRWGQQAAQAARDTVQFVREAYAELFKITWPTQPELKRATLSILVLSVILGLAIGFLDKVLSLILVDGGGRVTR